MENSAPERQQVRVTILSRPYTLLTTGDSREVEEVAASVNDLMLSIAAKAPNADSTRIAVLACLHLADSCARWSAISANSRNAWTARPRSSPGCWNNSSRGPEKTHDLAYCTVRCWPGWRYSPRPPIRPKSPNGANSGKRA